MRNTARTVVRHGAAELVFRDFFMCDRLDDVCAHFHSEVHDLADLLRVRFAERASEHREILSEDVDQTPIHASMPGDDAVTRVLLLLHAEIKTSMRYEFVDLFKGIFVEKQ